MKTHKNIYEKIYNKKNLILAWRKARKGKTKKEYVIEFEERIIENINLLNIELKNQTYIPRPMKTFVFRDPKTRKISKSHFRDRVIHHAICNILDPIFDKVFIHDNCANRKRKGSLFAINQFNKYKRKVTNNLTSSSCCFKADIKHYFREVNHEVLLNIIKRKIKDKQVMSLIKVVLERERERDVVFR